MQIWCIWTWLKICMPGHSIQVTWKCKIVQSTSLKLMAVLTVQSRNSRSSWLGGICTSARSQSGMAQSTALTRQAMHHGHKGSYCFDHMQTWKRKDVITWYMQLPFQAIPSLCFSKAYNVPNTDMAHYYCFDNLLVQHPANFKTKTSENESLWAVSPANHRSLIAGNRSCSRQKKVLELRSVRYRELVHDLAFVFSHLSGYIQGLVSTVQLSIYNSTQ